MTELEKAARMALEALTYLVEHDSYGTEYDGRIIHVCPSCSKQDGEHSQKCDFVKARQVITALTQALDTTEPVPERLREAFQKRGFVVPNTLHEAINSAANIMCEDGTIIAHHDAKRTTTEPVKPLFATKVAAQKWAELQEQGHRMQTIWFDGGPGGAGTIDPWGKVTWSKTEPATTEHDCSRSHPHENMSPMCELRTEIARLRNENTRLKHSTTEHKGPLSKDRIREVFLAHGFTVKEGQTDLKPYVYDAAYALIALVQQPTERKGEPVGEVDQIDIDEDGQAYAWVSLQSEVELGTKLYTSPQETERKGEPVATVRTIRGVTIGYLETRLPDGTSLYASPQVPEGVEWFTVAEHGLPHVGEEVIGGYWYTDPWLKPEFATRFIWGLCRVFADDRRDCPGGKRWQTFGPAHNQITHWARLNLPAIDAAQKDY